MKTLSSALPIALTLVILSPTAAGAQVPSAPVIRGSAPASPSSSNTPRIFGGSDAGTTVTLYESADCTGPVEDRGAALGFWFKGLQAQVVDNAIATFTATAEAGGLVSACSAPYLYQELTTPPTSTPTTVARPKCSKKKRNGMKHRPVKKKCQPREA